MSLEVDVPAHTDISYVVPPTPVTFLTLLWRLGLRVGPWALGWQSICPLTFMASLSGKRRTEEMTKYQRDSNNNTTFRTCRLVVRIMTILNDKNRTAVWMITWSVLVSEAIGLGMLDEGVKSMQKKKK